MRPVLGLVLVCTVFAAGCATQAATSGRVVIRDERAPVDIGFSRHDRAVIEQYYRALPSGLAKDDGGLPPGLARPGALPPGLAADPLPTELERQLSPLPAAYVRVRVGRDVVLIERRTRRVLDVLYGIAG